MKMQRWDTSLISSFAKEKLIRVERLSITPADVVFDQASRKVVMASSNADVFDGDTIGSRPVALFPTDKTIPIATLSQSGDRDGSWRPALILLSDARSEETRSVKTGWSGRLMPTFFDWFDANVLLKSMNSCLWNSLESLHNDRAKHSKIRQLFVAYPELILTEEHRVECEFVHLKREKNLSMTFLIEKYM